MDSSLTDDMRPGISLATGGTCGRLDTLRDVVTLKFEIAGGPIVLHGHDTRHDLATTALLD